MTSINLLLCCLDLIFANVVSDKRQDLINRSFPGLPRNFFLPSFDETKAAAISIIEKLGDRQSFEDVMKVKNSRWEKVIRKFFDEKILQGNSRSIFSVDNFDFNYKKLNDLYETFIRNYGQFDERIFLNHPEWGSQYYGKQISGGDRSEGTSSQMTSLMPQTPLSGQDYSHTPSSKLSPISSCKQNIQKLQVLFTGTRGPQVSLRDILLCSCPDSILDDLRNRLDNMQEIFCTKLIAKGADRFQYAEALYYRLLESIINAELKTHGRFDLFVNDDVFNKTLIVLCLEIVLFAFSLHKELTVLLDCFKLEPFHFYKLIELAIRYNKDYFTNDIIKHLKAIEEQCLDSLAWTSGSVLWEKIAEHQKNLPTNQEVDLPPINQTPQNGSQNNSPSNSLPKSLRLFFRKFYQLAHLRLKDLVKNLQFNNTSDLLRKIWTLFEHSVTENTELMKDRHLDQILMCCVYVLCKIRVSCHNN